MSYAAPISRDGFHFNGDLFVEDGNNNRYKRASVAEINDLIRPDRAPASSKRPAKDQIVHWYQVQLKHYGLPSCKSKSAAKLHLLDALNNSTLAVPANIAKLEKDLRREFNAAEKQAKAAYTASLSEAKSKKTTAGRKRKNSDGAAVNVTVNITHSQSSNTVPAMTSTASPSQSPRKKQTARKGPPSRSRPASSASPLPFGPPSDSESPPPRKKMARGVPRATPRAASFKQEDLPETYSVVSPHALPPLGLLNGDYAITCDYITSNWGPPPSDFSLVFAMDPDKRTLWAAFDLDLFRGVLRMPQRPYEPDRGHPVPFFFRGQEQGDTNEIMFGDRHKGFVTFLGDGQIYGSFEDLLGDACHFEAQRIEGQPIRARRSAASMQQEFESYTWEEYDRLERTRWGGSGW